MNLGVIKAYILKEIVELVRSKFIILVYLFPSMVILLFGYGIRMEVTHSRTVILDHDNSKLSTELISKFEHSKYFDTRVLNKPENEILKEMKKGKVDILIIIPESFEKRLLHGQKTEIGIFVDSSFPMRGTTMQSYAEGVIYNAAQSYMKNIPVKNLITINNRNLFNQSMRDENAIVPGLIGIILLVAPAILSALLIVKEKETGTIFNFYSSPAGKIDFLIAKLTPPFILHSANIFILFLWATYLFEVPFRGSFFIYWLSSEIYIIISVGIGLLVSVITRTQIVALVATIIITVIPGFLYSGILMPISSMVGSAYIEAHIFPVMYFNHIVYDCFLIGQGFSSEKNVLYFGVLIFYAFVLLSLGTLFMKKEMR
ncbi:ABC-type multidrug transport system, permease component [Persephonella hydrogeniphila]|uniref:ABC-type multidrug transport system, permease component n=1 Tax=Persephonella hydrogeniphila TaxID=198703 RepID=A0A285MZW6_9AQUI|nr:ABC transporter permease [Persephonella hydrogeniphila]SNZ02729.1 ABC-type multidrug transport system, permease component [Persephonella hydrogeniphila]